VVDGKYKKVPKRKEHNWVWSPQGVIDMHRPERWGLLQFSTAEPGKAMLKPDPAQAARDYLHRVYYAQIEYRKKHGRFAATLDEVKGQFRAGSAGLFEPRLEVTRNGFEASVEQRKGDDGRERWRISQEARVTREPK
jgi:hypothetical protein